MIVDPVIENIGEVFANEPFYTIPSCVVFFQCVNAPDFLTRDSKGFYHTPYIFESVQKAELYMQALAKSCIKAYVTTTNYSYDVDTDNIVKYIRAMNITGFTMTPLAYTDRDVLIMNIPPAYAFDSKERLLGILMILNSKGYLIGGNDYIQSARNILEVM